MLISLSVKQASLVLGCSEPYIRQRIKNGKISAFMTDPYLGWKIPFTELLKLGVPPSIVKELSEQAREETRALYRRPDSARALEPFAFKKKALSTLRSHHIAPKT